MKSFVPAVIALVIGIVLGSWQPRGELLQARQEMDELRAKAKSSDCRGGRAIDGIRDILHARAPDVGPAADAEAKRPGFHFEAGDKPDAPTAETAPSEDAPPATPEEVREQVAAMKAALDARRSQAMAALEEQADLSDEQSTAVESTMAEMNAQLKAEVDALVATANDGDIIERRDLMEFAANSLDTVIAADDKLRDIIPADVYDTLDAETIDPFSYLSGDAVDSLSKLQALPEFE